MDLLQTATKSDMIERSWSSAVPMVMSPRLSAIGIARFFGAASTSETDGGAAASDELKRTCEDNRWSEGVVRLARHAFEEEEKRASMALKDERVRAAQDKGQKYGSARRRKWTRARHGGCRRLRRVGRARCSVTHPLLSPSSWSLLGLVWHGSAYWSLVCILHDVPHCIYCLFVPNIHHLALVWQ